MKTIGQVEKETGVSAHTLRYYDKIGLACPEQRSKQGQRLYSEELIQRIGFIKSAQSLHFSLDEIKHLIDLDQTTNLPKPEVRKLAIAKLEKIEKNINELQGLKLFLQKLLSDCEDSDEKTACPILQGIKEDNTHKEKKT